MRAKMHVMAIASAMLLVAAGIAQLGDAGRGGGRAAPADWPGPRPDKPVWLCIGPAIVEEGQEIGGLVAFGPVTIAGKVNGDVTSLGGAVVVRATGVVDGNVTAVCADIEVAEGAKVVGATQARQLPEMAAIDIGWSGDDGLRIIFGNAEIVPGDAPLGPRVVIGGNVTVRGGAKVSEIVAVGGDITIEQGADVGAARLVGGRLQRPGGRTTEKDEAIEPITITCEGLPHKDPDAPAAAWTTSTMEQGTESMTISTPPASDWQRRVRLALSDESWSMGIDTRIAAVVRRPAPDPTQAGQFETYPAWRGSPLYAPTDSDPVFANSTAVGVGLHIGASQAISQAGSQRSASRTVTMAVPASAQTLTEGLGGYGPVGGGYGGGDAGYGRGGFSGGGESAGGGRW